MSKITKSELKQNDFNEGIKLASYYLKNNLKVVIITMSSIFFIAIASSVILLIKSGNNKLSAEILSKAIGAYHSNGAQAAEPSKKSIIDSVALLKEILEKYPNTPSASIAYLYLGNLNFQLGDYPQALTYYQDFVSKYSTHTLINSAKKNMACIYESQNNLNEAAKIYEELSNLSEIDLKQKDEIKMDLARVYELQNQPDKAKSIYSQFSNNEEAQFRLGCLADK